MQFNLLPRLWPKSHFITLLRSKMMKFWPSKMRKLVRSKMRKLVCSNGTFLILAFLFWIVRLEQVLLEKEHTLYRERA